MKEILVAGVDKKLGIDDYVVWLNLLGKNNLSKRR